MNTRASLFGVTTLPAVGQLGARVCGGLEQGVWARMLGMQGDATQIHSI